MSRHARRLLSSSLLIAAVLQFAPAHECAEPKEEREEPRPSGLVEKVDVRLQQMTIFATDEEGRPVLDLKPEELRVKDGGSKVEVAFLDASQSLGVSGLEARMFVDAPGGPTEPVVTFGPEPRFMVVLLDLIHENQMTLETAQEQLAGFVAGRFDMDELVSILSYTGTLNLESPFTNDPDALALGVENAYRRQRVPAIDPAVRIRRLLQRLELCLYDDPDGIIACVNGVSGSYRQEAKLAEQAYLSVLLAAVEFASGLSGRKALVVLGQGASLSAELELEAAVSAVLGTAYTGIREGASFGFDQVISKAHRQGVVMHFVSQPPSSQTRVGANLTSRPEVGADPMELAHRGAAEAMSHLAQETGGVHVTNDDVGDGLQSVVALERSGYLLGYYVDRKKKDKGMHRVRIKCAREGVRITWPRRYGVEPPSEGTIDVRLNMAPPITEPGDGTFRIPFQIEAQPEDLGYKVKGDSATANFVVETAVFDESGRTITRTFNLINHSYDKAAWNAGEVEPLRIDGWVELPPGRYEIRSAIRNYENDTEGAVSRPFRLALEPEGT
jgi:VWFA-related protein